MKKIFLLAALTSIFYFAGCSNGSDSSGTSQEKPETVSLIPSINGKADENLAYSIPKTTASIFPYFFIKQKNVKFQLPT